MSSSEDASEDQPRERGLRESAEKHLRRGTRDFVEAMRYPHRIHPALVPGVSIEDQRVRYGVDKPLTLVVGLLIVAFVAWGVINPEQVFDYSSIALEWTMVNLGWIFTILATGLMFFLLILALSKYGKVPLGLDNEKPEYSTLSWAAMLFAAGIGIAIIFFGPYEPMSHYLSPRPGAYEPATQEAVRGAMAQSTMHWAINAWAIYAIVGLAVAYVSFRRGRVPLMSSILMPLFGNRSSSSWQARVIDGLAIIATLFGTAASLGLGALQIGAGVEVVSGWSTAGNQFAIVITVILTIGTIASAVSGVARGIRWLSNINLGLAVFLAVFFFVLGPTAFLANMLPAVLIDYVGSMPEMLAANMGEGEEMQDYLSGWTTFYWAWWVSWAPFVGVFVAKISRGRTIRQFVFGVLLIPSAIITSAFTILGGTAIWMQRDSQLIAPDNTAESMPAPEEIFFIVLEELPGTEIMAPLVIVMLAIFFITTADSASLVNSQMSQKGNPNPRRIITAFWALCMAGIAVVILLAGGENALQGLQNFITITALPFAIIIIGMCVALVRELRSDPYVIRYNFERRALSNAVREGVRLHGDNFSIDVGPTSEGDEYAAGTGFDSTADRNTEWYQRTDEDGNPIDFDYDTGTYPDER
ncbi:BCCT family transporter [Corynebacterium yudongzhengii]